MFLPMRTNLGVFSVVLDCRHHRLANLSQHSKPGELENRYKMKAQIKGLNTTLAMFYGFQQINFLAILACLKDAFYAFGKSEEVAVRALAFFLSDYKRECYMSYMRAKLRTETRLYPRGHTSSMRSCKVSSRTTSFKRGATS